MEITHTDQPPSAEDHAKLELLKSNYLEKLDREVSKTVGMIFLDYFTLLISYKSSPLPKVDTLSRMFKKPIWHHFGKHS